MLLKTRIHHPEKDKKIKTFASYDELIQTLDFKNNLEIYPSDQPILDTQNKHNFFIETQREAAWRLLSNADSRENLFIGSVASLSAYVWAKGKKIDAAWVKNLNDLNEGTMRNLKERCNYVVDLASASAYLEKELDLKPSFAAILQYEALSIKPEKSQPSRARAMQFIRHGFIPVERVFVSCHRTKISEGTIYKKKLQK